jgi:hypothetical protein
MVFSPSSTPTIAIVGAGLSGSLVAAHLLKTAQRPLAIGGGCVAANHPSPLATAAPP